MTALRRLGVSPPHHAFTANQKEIDHVHLETVPPLVGIAFGLLVSSGTALAADTLTPQQISEQLVGKTFLDHDNLSGNRLVRRPGT